MDIDRCVSNLLECVLRGRPIARRVVHVVGCQGIDSFRRLDRGCPLDLWRRWFVDVDGDLREELERRER